MRSQNGLKSNNMANIEEFLLKDRSMLIAPAGFGKTYTITECILLSNESKKHLILTHTHAGVASIKEKMKSQGVDFKKYNIETICSFALQLTNNYHLNKDEIPNAENGNEYFGFAISTASKLLNSEPIKTVIKSKFSHLIVDEYQDCTQNQHQFILLLSEVLKTHILGDPLQGIFGFKNSTLVNMDSSIEMGEFKLNVQELITPWRWKNSNSMGLGTSIMSIRDLLLKKQTININDYSNDIQIVIQPEANYTVTGSAYKQTIWKEINDPKTQSLLLIHPISTSVQPRIKFLQQFSPLRLIESIDDKDYYKYSILFDKNNGQKLIDSILEFSKFLFLSNVIDTWFNNGVIKKKRSPEDKIIAESLQIEVNKLHANKSYDDISRLINKIQYLPNNKCYRKDFINEIISALQFAHKQNVSVYEAMKRNRDKIRRQGRSVKGKCIGTTLLTKGLEFDTVIVLNAHKFDDPKHFYVAISRACKKLIIISENPVIYPYQDL